MNLETMMSASIDIRSILIISSPPSYFIQSFEGPYFLSNIYFFNYLTIPRHIMHVGLSITHKWWTALDSKQPASLISILVVLPLVNFHIMTLDAHPLILLRMVLGVLPLILHRMILNTPTFLQITVVNQHSIFLTQNGTSGPLS